MLGGHLSLRGEPGGTASWYVTASARLQGRRLQHRTARAGAPTDLRSRSTCGTSKQDCASLRRLQRSRRELAVFHMWRDDQQISTSSRSIPVIPLSYIFLTDNAASGRNYGLEAELRLARPVNSLRLAGTLGLLHTEYIDYRYGDRDLDGRDQAHAPEWQYSLSADVAGVRVGFSARADVAGTAALLLRREPRPALRAPHARQSQGRLVWSQLGGLALGSQRVRRELRRARFLFRPRAAGVRRTSSTCSVAIRVRSA